LIETLKTLEVAEVEKGNDPRPNKRSRIQFEGLPRSEALRQKGKARAVPKDDDVVSLGYTEDEEMGRVGSDIADDDVHDVHNDMDFDVEGEISDLARIIDSYWQVQSPIDEPADADIQTELDSFIAVCNNNSCLPCSHECDCRNDEHKEWIIYSGASLHFTNSVNDFIDYEVLEDKKFIKTANSSAHIEGKGTILSVLSTGEVLRIYPVYHVPNLNCKLCQGHSNPKLPLPEEGTELDSNGRTYTTGRPTNTA